MSTLPKFLRYEPDPDDPEIFWCVYATGDRARRRKDRTGYVVREDWRRARTASGDATEMLERFRNVILCYPRTPNNFDLQDMEMWLAYSPDFAVRKEGESPPLYAYNRSTGKWEATDFHPEFDLVWRSA